MFKNSREHALPLKSSLWERCQKLRGRVLPRPWALPLGDGNAEQSCPWLALPSPEDLARSSCGGLFEKIRGSCHTGQSRSQYLAYLCRSLSPPSILLSTLLCPPPGNAGKLGQESVSTVPHHLLELQVSLVDSSASSLYCACSVMQYFFHTLQILDIWLIESGTKYTKLDAGWRGPHLSLQSLVQRQPTCVCYMNRLNRSYLHCMGSYFNRSHYSDYS